MNKELHENFRTYEAVYFILQKGEQSISDVSTYLMEEADYSRSKAYRHIGSLKSDPNSMVAFDDEYIWIDEEKFHPFIEEYMLSFNVDSGPSDIDIDSKDDEINILREEVEKLKQENDRLNSENGVVLLDTLEIVEDEPYDDFLVGYFKPTTDEVELCNNQRKWTRDSFYKVIDNEEKELNAENEKKRTIRSLCKDIFFLQKKDDKEVLSEMKDADEDKANDVINNRRRYFALRLLQMKDIPNKDKIAMYASFGRYKNQEMESLINYCNDECINANLMIETLEDAAEKDDFEGLRDFFRQMIKTSHSSLKMEFAKELIKGEWYIVCDYNGKKQKFQLMPVEDITKEDKNKDESKKDSSWDNPIMSGGGFVE